MHKTRDEKILAAMKKLAVEQYGVTFIWKDESPLMKVLYVVSFMWIWNREFMTNYTTTVGNRVYWGTNKREGENQAYRMLRTLAHELRHIVRKNHDGHASYTYDYMSPQLFGIIALLFVFGAGVGLLFFSGVISPWTLVGALGLAFLGPWPSEGRTRIEVEGYTMTHAVDIWSGHPVDKPHDFIVENLTTMKYYKPCWDRAQLVQDLQAGIDVIKSGDYEKQSTLALQIKTIIKTGGEL